MEIIFILVGIMLLAAFTFALIEYPYYLVGVFVFLHIYNFNFELPGPLDLRGMISIILLLRLTIFDKINMDHIKELITNNFFVLLMLFSLYTVIIDLSSKVSLLTVVRTFILNFITFLLGFLTVRNGYLRKTIVIAILIAGLFSIGDLIYSYSYKNVLYIRRIIDLILGRHPEGMNHNMFGGLCGMALIITLVLFVNKNITKRSFFILGVVYALGIILSTSRMTLLMVTFTLILILFTQHQLDFSLKKVFKIFAVITLFFILISFSFNFILTAINVDKGLTEKIYWRLFEEPLTFLDDDNKKYTASGYEVEGSITWRIEHTLRDVNVFLNQSTSVILFGFGTGGYRKIGEVSFRGVEAIQYSAHNFYTDAVIEYGVVGLCMFLLFFLLLLYQTIKNIKQGVINFSMVYILLYMFLSTFGSDASLTEKFGYILYGCVIADFVMVNKPNRETSNIGSVKARTV